NEAAMRLLLKQGPILSEHQSELRAYTSLSCLPQVFASMDQNWPGAKHWRDQLGQILIQQVGSLDEWQSRLSHCLEKLLSYPEQTEAHEDLLAVLSEPRRRQKSLRSSSLSLWPNLTLVFAHPIVKPASTYPNPKALDLGDSHKKSASEREGKTAKRPKLIEHDPESNNPLAHVFEKTQTAESYQGGQRNLDDSDQMDEHGQALDEVDFQHVLRTKSQAGSFINMDHEGVFVAEQLENEHFSSDRVYTYSEWSDRKQLYLKDWCTVRESYPSTSLGLKSPPSIKVKKQGRMLRQYFESLFNRRLWINRQADGSEMDYDRLVSREADIRAGAHPDNLIYMDKRILCLDFSCVILMDASLSTDAWIKGLRVLDQLKEVLNSLAIAMEGLAFHCEVAAFYSQTRQDCRYQILKEFDEHWTVLGPRLDAIEPTGYTRIGPALRHSIARLQKKKARHRLILLLSDAKPTDFDAYEGRHGIKDVRRAVLEAERDDIRVRTLAVAASKNRQVFNMFGHGCVQFLGDKEELAQQILKLILQVIQQR
ncbi:MAG: hypothetical protein NTX25_10795, partial [Proteobacteria bacterium]|nr:hypothetical protein [Pseudomonadota bacterium]